MTRVSLKKKPKTHILEFLSKKLMELESEIKAIKDFIKKSE